MAASRKLQAEIDRVLKKVQEGVDVFDSIWNKVYDTDNANQKEKFEADLKKEIKKLQRYRDQIKTWIQSSEIKDKKVSASYEQALMDARKLIEREMERFKICEKETKTKAFSKEGLVQQPKTDPREKAKSETRDWLNNLVSELESQIDNFEAEIEGLPVKKGKTKPPPRLVHLEASITRHKAHIIKLELILRLLDNDELSPEEVNDVKEMLEDYVERNQDDFEEFSDVDELYSSLPLDKVESLEDLPAVPSVVKGVSETIASPSSKTPLASIATQMHATTTSNTLHIPEPIENNIASINSSHSEVIPRTPPPSKSHSIFGSSSTTTIPTPLVVSHATSPVISANASPRNIIPTISSITTNIMLKEEEIASRRSSPAPTDSGLVRSGISKSGISQPSSIPSNGGGVGSVVPSAADIAKRNINTLGGGGSGVDEVQRPLVSLMSSDSSNRIVLPQPQAAKAANNNNEGTVFSSIDTVNGNVPSEPGSRVFSPSAVPPSMQWRPGTSFQTQNELLGQIRGRTEIAPDQREKFLEKLNEVQQPNYNNYTGMPSHNKQFSTQQQHNPLLQQFNSQSSSVSSTQAGLPGVNTVTPLQQQRNLIHQQSTQQPLIFTGQQETDVAPVKVEEQQLSFLDDTAKSAQSFRLGKNLMNEDDFKSSNTIDSTAGVSGDPTQVPRDAPDLSPKKLIQISHQPSAASLGVIGRRSVSDHLSTIGDSSSGSSSTVNYGGDGGAMHDQLYNLQMLEAAFHNLPQPKDSERQRNYTPKHPVVAPPSYPQIQAPIVNNLAFWDRLGVENNLNDTLFFAFYYQQNTYQQYLAAKELKKQSWRYHWKFDTWFQRHEEPKLASDDFEQGTYVYFDFHMNDEQQTGWCRRLKHDFTFEYKYLEDELMP